MSRDVEALFDRQFGVATSGQLFALVSRRKLQSLLATGEVCKIWPGVYTSAEVNTLTRLRGLDLRVGEPVAACLGTAAAAYGFDTECTIDLHVLTPKGHQLRGGDGLVVHRRDGAPLVVLNGRLVTAPAWTAVEVARCLPRPRALATLDGALRSGTCDRHALTSAAVGQAGRRGIVEVRKLIPLAAPQSESPMESEARLAIIDADLPLPVLQFEIVDRTGRTWRVDFAWPDHRLAVEYDGFDWHSGPADLRRDRQKRAALREEGWTMLSIVSDDVRRRTHDMVRRIRAELSQSAAA